MATDLPTIVEALIFSSPEGITTVELGRVIREAAGIMIEEMTAEERPTPAELSVLAKTTEEEAREAVGQLIARYEDLGLAFSLAERAKGWRVFVRGEFAKWARPFFPGRKANRLSPPALETLAIIAYRQPITKADVESIRGVSADGVLQTILDRQLVRVTGRSDLPGRPLLYETTELFLDHFGISRVEDLPNSKELRLKQLPGKEEPSETPTP